jgi:integrase
VTPAQDGRKERRANKEGKPWQRPDGRWTARAYGPEANAKPHYVYGKTRADAKDKRDALERELAAGMPAKDMSLGQYLDAWLSRTLVQEVAAGHLAGSTLDSYADNARKHIVPDLGHIALRALTVSRVRQWQYDLGRKPSGRPRRKLRPGEKKLPPPPPLSPRTVAYCHAILRRALNDAKRDELVAKNVAALVKPPKPARRERAALTPDQVAALLEASSGDTLWCYWLVVLTLGLRRGEGLALRWADLDFGARTVRMTETVQRIRGEADPVTGRRRGRLVSKGMKTDASEATAPVGDGLLEALRLHQREQLQTRMRSSAWLDADLIFTTSVGTALEPRNVNRAWAAVCSRAGVPGAKIHDLRHACGTYLANAGLPLKAVSSTLRHSRTSTTEMYVHALEETNREAAETMDAIVTDLRRRARGASRKSS